MDQQQQSRLEPSRRWRLYIRGAEALLRLSIVTHRWQRWWRHWRPSRRKLLWTGSITALAFLIIVICGYLFGWKWSGLPKRTLWDWLDLLIVPVVLAIGGYLFTRSENRATQSAAERRAQDDTLQAYLEGMSHLITDKELPLHNAQPNDSLSTVARAQTLTVLSRLDGGRKRSVLAFLYGSHLIERGRVLLDESKLIERRHSIVDLEQADLSKANLSGANLSGAKLRRVDLNRADLSEADLIEAKLTRAKLSRAKLTRTKLSLSLNDPSLIRLRRIDLSKADLRPADLSGAKLIGADLRGPS